MKLMDKWNVASPEQKKKYVLVAAGICVLFAAAIGTVFSKSKTKRAVNKTTPQTTVLTAGNKNVTQEMIVAQMEGMQRRMESMERSMRDGYQKTQEMTEAQRKESTQKEQQMLENLNKQIQEMEGRLKGGNPKGKGGVNVARPGSSSGGPGLNSPLPQGGQPAIRLPASETASGVVSIAGSPQQSAPAVQQKKFRSTFEGSTEARLASAPSAPKGAQATQPTKANPDARSSNSRRDEKKPGNNTLSSNKTIYLASGSILQGVLLTGMDAPTSHAGKEHPTPALIRIKNPTIMPNFRKADIRECFLLVGGHGVMSTERAMLRTEKLSCFRGDGRSIDTKIDGYVVGDDGKAGLRGTLVSKQGSVLAQSMVAGFFSGMGDALKPSSVTTTDLTGGSGIGIKTVKPDISATMEKGAYAGLGQSFKSVGDFYLSMAKEMFPVVEISAGRTVEVVLVNGSKLDPQ